jgi:calcium-independent phospholipase A2-gamma
MEILRHLEINCKKPIHELFDYICGVSTGSLIGIMLGVYRLSLDEAEQLYKTFSREIFNQYKLMGVGKLVVSQGYYDAQLWEKILQ